MDKRAQHVIDVFNFVLGRDPTQKEISKYRMYGTDMLKMELQTIKQQQETKKVEPLLKIAKNIKLVNGVSLVSTYNVQCGIATYTENLFAALKGKTRVCVLSERDRNRNEKADENNVFPCWSRSSSNYAELIESAIFSGNRIIHFQHEHGLFKDEAEFKKLVHFLKNHGFKIVITAHTVFGDNKFKNEFLNLADAVILHSESAAQFLQPAGIEHVTVIPHGTEEPLEIKKKDANEFVKNLVPGLNLRKHILGCSVGFITPNKMQLETLEAVKEACKKEKNLKFLLIGSTARRDNDDSYFYKLKELEDENIIVAQSFLTREQIAKVLIASRFAIMNYEQTNYSISGASHLLMTYGVPSISSRSRILEDLDESISLKIDKQAEMPKKVIKMCKMIKKRDPKLTTMKKLLLSTAKKTSWKETAKNYIKVYNHILKGN